MSTMVLHKNFNEKRSPGYSPGGDRLTENIKPRSTRQMIEEMMIAGERLQIHRQLYDYPDGTLDKNAVPNPVRSGNFDLADATQLHRSLSKKIESALPIKNDSTKVESKEVEQKNETSEKKEPAS